MELQKILVDTDVLIDFLRKKESAKEILQRALTTGDTYISVITLSELLAGMRQSEEEATENLIAGFNLLFVDEEVARRAGKLRSQYRNKNILLPDCLIAATALETKCLLLTFNQKDYPFDELKFFT